MRAHELLVGAAPEAGRLALTGTVNALEPLGSETLVHLAVGDSEVVATAPGKSGIAVGEMVTAAAPAGGLYVFDAETERFLGRA